MTQNRSCRSLEVCLFHQFKVIDSCTAEHSDHGHQSLWTTVSHGGANLRSLYDVMSRPPSIPAHRNSSHDGLGPLARDKFRLFQTIAFAIAEMSIHWDSINLCILIYSRHFLNQILFFQPFHHASPTET